MSVMAGVSDTVMANRDKLRGKIEQTKVKRYWPGKAPEWADDADEEGDIKVARAVALEKAFPSHRGDYSIFVGKDDPRLRRLGECRIDDRDKIRVDRRLMRQAEIVSPEEEEVAQEAEDEDALEERRRRIRERLLHREQEETAVLAAEEEEEEDNESSEEYETDSEEEEHMETAISVQLVYVPKSERGTIAERELLKAKERATEEFEKRKLEARKAETKQLVVEKMREDEQKINQTELMEANVDSDDETNEAEEYEAWHAREMARVKMERSDLNMETKNEEMKDEEKNNQKPKPIGATKKGKRNKFMQKYYHKGAFFRSDADWPAAVVAAEDIGTIFDRDFSAPTGEDKMDKTLLPKIMQVKNFGRRGRTKWTHLLNEDTTDYDNPWTYNG